MPTLENFASHIKINGDPYSKNIINYQTFAGSGSLDDSVSIYLQNDREQRVLNKLIGRFDDWENADGIAYSSFTSLTADLDKFLFENVVGDFYMEVSKGNVPGHSIVHKFGHNDAIGTTLVLMSNSGLYPTPTAVTALEVVSDSVDDAAGGIGARIVQVIGLDATFTQIEQDVNLDGVTPVAVPISLCRLFRGLMPPLSSGTYATALPAVSSHVGTLTIREAGAGATWAIINGATTKPHAQTQIGAYTVPAGKTAELLNIFLHVDANKTVDVLLFVREGADVIVAPFDPMRIQSEFRGVEGSTALTLKTPRKYPEKTDIIWLAKVGSGTADAAIDFEILLINNDLVS